MTTTAVIIAVATMWVLFSAALVVFICMNSSRLSQAEELPRDHRPRKSAHRRTRKMESPAAAIAAGTSILGTGGQ